MTRRHKQMLAGAGTLAAGGAAAYMLRGKLGLVKKAVKASGVGKKAAKVVKKVAKAGKQASKKVVQVVRQSGGRTVRKLKSGAVVMQVPHTRPGATIRAAYAAAKMKAARK